MLTLSNISTYTRGLLPGKKAFINAVRTDDGQPHQLRSLTNSVPDIITGSVSMVGFHSCKGVLQWYLKFGKKATACPS